MVQYLLENSYKDLAASLCGAVLENGLRQIASRKGITARGREDLRSLNQKCVSSGTYNRFMQEQIQVWINVRNDADHANFSEYTEGDVKEMHNGVCGSLTQFLQQVAVV